MSQLSPVPPLARGRARFEATYRIRFDESGPDGRLPASGYLRYAQDLAWLHSSNEGFDRAWYGQRGLSWLIRAIELDVLEGAAYGEELHVSTEVLGFRRVWARRRSEFSHSHDQRPLALATIDWVLLNSAGQPVRVPLELSESFEAQAETAFTPLRVQLGEALPEASRSEFAVRRSELDPMAHVNNAAYLDYLDELLASAGQAEEAVRLPRRYRLEYVRPAEQGARLRGSLWRSEAAWSCRLESAQGAELLRARLETQLADFIGA